MNNGLMVSALLAHFIGDFLLQTNEIAALKSKNVKGVALHCCMIFFSNLLLMSFGIKSIPLIFLLTIVHFCIDCIKLKIKNVKFQFFYLFIDQICHFTSITLICLLFSRFNLHSSFITDYKINYYKIIIFFISVTYVSTIIIKQFYFSFEYLNPQDNVFFDCKERELDIIFNFIFSLNMILSYSYWYIVDIILCIIYILIHVKLIKYKKTLLYGKLMFFIMFSIICFSLL